MIAPRIDPGRYGLWGLLGSEWTKLRTVRSTMWSLGLIVVLGIGLSALVCVETTSHWATMGLVDRLTFDPTQASLVGVLFAQLVIGVLGVLVMSAEYGTGTIRATLAAAPRRPLVLVAKCLVFSLVSLVVCEAVAFLAYFVGQSLLTTPTPHSSLSDPGVLRAVVGAGLYLAVLGLFALGLATIIRHTAGAISAFVAVLLIFPLINAALPTSISDAIDRYLPARIGHAMIAAQTGPHEFGPWVGLGVLCGYAAAVLILGAVVLVRRDA